jgi:hypothetical protein
MSIELGIGGTFIERQLSALGFDNALQIVQSAKEVENPASPPWEEYRQIHMMEPLGGVKDARFEFWAYQVDPSGPWVIMRAAGKIESIVADIENKDKIIVKYFDDHPLPHKGRMTRDLFDAQKLEQVKADLIFNGQVRDELSRIGFLNYDEIVSTAAQLLGWTHLRTEMPVNEKIGTGADMVEFLITLRRPLSERPSNIVSITATLDSPGGFKHADGGPTSIMYDRSERGFPSASKMVDEVIRQQEKRLRLYANAYKIVKGMNAVAQNIHKSHRNKQSRF